MTNRPLTAAVLVSDDYQDLEFWYPVLRLREDGIAVTILAPSGDATFYSCLGYPVVPDRSIADAGEDYDLLVIPGGEAATKLAADPAAVGLATTLAGKRAQIVTIGEGAQVLAAAGVPSDASCENADGLPQLFQKLLATN